LSSKKAENKNLILDLLHEHESLTTSQIAEELKVSKRTVIRYVDELKQECLVETDQRVNGGVFLIPGLRRDRSYLSAGQAQNLKKLLKLDIPEELKETVKSVIADFSYRTEY